MVPNRDSIVITGSECLASVIPRRHLIQDFLIKNGFDDLGPLHTGESRVEPLELETERIVVDAELVQHGGMEIVDRADVLYSGIAEVVGGAVHNAPTNA